MKNELHHLISKSIRKNTFKTLPERSRRYEGMVLRHESTLM